MGDLVQIASQAVESVTAFNADSLHLDQNLAVTRDRIRHVLVAEDIRASRLVIDRCLHCPYPLGATSGPLVLLAADLRPFILPQPETPGPAPVPHGGVGQ